MSSNQSITGGDSLTEELVAFGLDWHLTGSRAFDSLLIEPLRQSARVDLRRWDGQELTQRVPPGRPTIFCMFPPSEPAMRTAGARLVWIPMWDHARIYSKAWWNSLSPDLRVVAFSEPVRQRAEAAGLQTLKLTYFMDPAQSPPANWTGERVALYWNRTGMLAPAALERFCGALSISKLFFRDQLDPRISERLHYALPPRLGDTEVVSIEPRDREEYLEVTEMANVMIAPRTCEGVGLTFLEGMARGCCVLGYDAPTMNEYIRDGHNGLLFRSHHSRRRPAALLRLARRSPHPVNVDQPWRRFSEENHRALGEQARMDHVAGHQRWLESLPAYSRFILDW